MLLLLLLLGTASADYSGHWARTACWCNASAGVSADCDAYWYRDYPNVTRMPPRGNNLEEYSSPNILAVNWFYFAGQNGTWYLIAQSPNASYPWPSTYRCIAATTPTTPYACTTPASDLSYCTVTFACVGGPCLALVGGGRGVTSAASCPGVAVTAAATTLLLVAARGGVRHDLGP